MRVKIIDVDQTSGAETLRCECDLSECFPDDDEACAAAQLEIATNGRAWVGGGAAALVLLKRVPS